MSHEVRTPINGIKGLHYLALQQNDWQQARSYIEQADGALGVLLRVLNDVLDFSKMEAGKLDLMQEPINVASLADEMLNLLQFEADIKSIKLSLDFDKTSNLVINTDPIRLKQVLLNLLTNAIKFTPEDGTVKAELIEKQSGIIVKVSDSGIGISQDNIERLAKPFEQVVDGATKHKEGTGLGLALSKSLVELHGGNFKIESVLGEGTTVIFSLPNQPVTRQEETPRNQVSQEISRLAQDIATVLSENSEAEHAPQQQANIAQHFENRAQADTQDGDETYENRGAA